MIIENSYLTHSNGKILSTVGFALMALYELAVFGVSFLGWYNGFFAFILDIAYWANIAGIAFAAIGALLMYNEGREITDIILCGTMVLCFIFQWIPSPHMIVTLIFNLIIYSYLAAFAFDAFKKENQTFAIIFAALLVYAAVVAPLLNTFAWNVYYGWGYSFISKVICYPIKNFNNLVYVALPALALLETTKKELKKAE